MSVQLRKLLAELQRLKQEETRRKQELQAFAMQQIAGTGLFAALAAGATSTIGAPGAATQGNAGAGARGLGTSR